MIYVSTQACRSYKERFPLYGIHNFEPAVSTSLYHLYIMPGLGQYTYARSYYNSHRSCNDYGVAYSGGTCYHGGGYSGGSSYYGGGGYYDGSEVDCRDLPCWGTRCCRIFVVIVFAFLAAIIITSVIVLPVTLTTRSPGSGNNLEGTRMVSFSNFFCSGIGIRAASSSVTLIEKTPPLIRNVGVTRHNVRYSGRIAVKTWQSYLLPNSNVTVFVRNARSPVPVWVIRGRNDWTSYNYRGLPNEFAVATGNADGFLYTTTSEDEYYFAYYPGPANSESTIVFYVEQFQYSTANLTSQPNCSADKNVLYTCTIPVPYGRYNRALIVSNSRWSWSCNTREWAYAVVVLVSFIFAVFVVLIVGVGIALCCKLKRKSTQKETTTTESESSSDPKASPQDHGLEMTENPTADTTDKNKS